VAPPILSARAVSKRYVLEHKAAGGPTDLRETLAHGLANLARRLRPGGVGARRVESEEFWALRDVSLELAEGDVVGILGRNGAGKSTLLKLISRIMEPTAGEIRIRGRVGSLLEVGTGFHPDLTGRENIFLNGAILGMSRAEIRRKFDQIVDFAEIERFLDTPVKRYSSGMYVRLAFSVAAHLEPEILIIDEVLAVGDAAFQKKSLDRMSEVAAEGRTVLFVSHNLGLIRTLCKRGILLEAGTVRFDGTADDAVRTYLEGLQGAAGGAVAPHVQRHGRGLVHLRMVEASAPVAGGAGLESGRPARFVFHTSQALPGLSCIFDIFDSLGQHVTYFDSANTSPDDGVDDGGEARFVCELDELLLLPGRYRIDVALNCDGELQEHVEGAAVIDVHDGVAGQRRIVAAPGYGSAFMHHRWVSPRGSDADASKP
jgi:lipopolysaccharide transport system ATP-binding protein